MQLGDKAFDRPPAVIDFSLGSGLWSFLASCSSWLLRNTASSPQGHEVEIKQSDVTKHLQVAARAILPRLCVLLYTEFVQCLPGFAERCFPTAQVLKTRSEGMPHRDDPASFGDLHVKAGKFEPRSR